MRLTKAQQKLLHDLRTLPKVRIVLYRVGPTWVDARWNYEGMMSWPTSQDDPSPMLVDPMPVNLRDVVALLRAGHLTRPPAVGGSVYETTIGQVSMFGEALSIVPATGGVS